MKINTTGCLLAVMLACVLLFSACQPTPSHNSSVYTEITTSTEKTTSTVEAAPFVTTVNTGGTTISSKRILTTHNHKHLRSIYFNTIEEYTTAFSGMHSFADVCQLFNERTTSSRFNEDRYEMMLKDGFFLLLTEQEEYPYRLDDSSIQFFMGGSISFPLECPHGNELSIGYQFQKENIYENLEIEEYLVNKAGQTIYKVYIGSEPRYFWYVDGYPCEMNWLSSSDVCTEECTRSFFETVLFEKVYIDQPDDTTGSTTTSKTQHSLS